VPLADLGLDSQDIPDLSGDLGVIFSDPAGRDRVERVYYYNKSTGTVSDLTAEATLMPREWGKIQFPIGQNLLQNSSFESPLRDDKSTGWAIDVMKNDSEIKAVKESPHSGASALRLRQTKPVDYPENANQIEDYRQFLRSANKGNGRSYSSIKQRVPVESGTDYSLRLTFRSEGLRREIQRIEDEDRGWATLQVWVDWIGNIEGSKRTTVADKRETQLDWTTILNEEARNHSVKKPYTAPEGAIAADIVISITTTVPNITPVAYVDDVEFVEMPK
jgi:hypothetical protein